MTDNASVAEATESAPQATDEEASAPSNDLDDLLSQLDQEFTDDTTPGKDTDKVTVLESRLAQIEQEKTDQDINKAVSVVQQSLELPIKIPDRWVRGLLNDLAVEDPRFMRAFQNRRNDPKAWDRVLKAAAKSAAKDFEMIDTQATESRNAMTAALRGTSTVKAEDESAQVSRFLANATDSQFAEWKRTGKVPDSWKG